MNRFIIIILCFVASVSAYAQEFREQVFASTDKQCYVVGERLHTSVNVSMLTAEGLIPSPSKVAYVEISDTKQIWAQAMVALTDGVGWADIPLPVHMHSGCYQLTVYTRAMRNYDTSDFFTSIIGVVNPSKVSRRDMIEFQPIDAYEGAVLTNDITPTIATSDIVRGGEVMVIMPENGGKFCTMSVERMDVMTNEKGKPHVSAISTNSTDKSQFFIPEIEGHIIASQPSKNKDLANSRIAMVGMQSRIFDGQRQKDGSYLYFTSDLYGNLPTLINGYDYDKVAVPMQIQSPYAKVLPLSLPKLTVYCSDEELLARNANAQKVNAVSEYLASDTLSHSVGFMDKEPQYFYDLDEWTKFNTIREIIFEFVKGVSRRKVNGVHQLFTLIPELHVYSTWPALVLLDGMPVHDIDEILEYDAHLVKYVQVYTDKFTFGSTACQGVISFITRKGRLANYTLDAGSRLVSYKFPQDHPQYVNYTSSSYGTVYWNPFITEREVTFTAPTETGKYQIVVQGIDHEGKAYKASLPFELH